MSMKLSQKGQQGPWTLQGHLVPLIKDLCHKKHINQWLLAIRLLKMKEKLLCFCNSTTTLSGVRNQDPSSAAIKWWVGVLLMNMHLLLIRVLIIILGDVLFSWITLKASKVLSRIHRPPRLNQIRRRLTGVIRKIRIFNLINPAKADLKFK